MRRPSWPISRGRAGEIWLVVGLGSILALGPGASASAGGSQLWAARYSGPGSDTDAALSVAVSPGGSKVFVTGTSGTLDGYEDLTTLAYSASSGAEIWERRYDGPGHRHDVGMAVVVSPDGSNVFVTGESQGTTSDYDFLTVAYASTTGKRRWLARYNGPGNGFDRPFSETLSPDGSMLFVGGGSTGNTGSEDFAVVAYDTATGALLWVSRYEGTGHALDEARDIALSPDGAEVYVTGISYGVGTDYDYATVAYVESSGKELWVRRYNGPTDTRDEPTAVAVSPGGGQLFVTGYGGGDYTTIAYEAASGSILWVQGYDGRGGATAGLAVAPGGGMVFVSGLGRGALGDSDYATVAYSASAGEQLWVALYDGPQASDDIPYALALSPGGGTVYVTGSSPCCADGDWATVAYASATGTKRWSRRYRCCGYGLSIAYSIVVSPGGSRVFVAGTSPGPEGDNDLATVAYSA